MKTLIVAVALFVSSVAMAQPGPGPGGGPRGRGMKNPERRDQIDAQRSAYITTRIGLSSVEAQKFWPIYNQRQAELEVAREIHLLTVREPRKVYAGKTEQVVKVPLTEDEWTNAHCKEMIESRFKMDEEKLRIERKYYQEFLKVISIKQVALLYKAEEEFKKEILREIKRRR